MLVKSAADKPYVSLEDSMIHPIFLGCAIVKGQHLHWSRCVAGGPPQVPFANRRPMSTYEIPRQMWAVGQTNVGRLPLSATGHTSGTQAESDYLLTSLAWCPMVQGKVISHRVSPGP